jgi:restriction endonuclease S subunit
VNNRPSGFEWLGDLPAHWEVKPLFTVLSETHKRNTQQAERNLLSLSYGRIVPKDIDSPEGLLPESFETYQIVRPGDIVLRLTDLQNDQRSLRVGRVPTQGIITSAYVNLRPADDASSRFFFYQLFSIDVQKVFYHFGGGVRQSMRFADLKRLPVAVPPISDQRSIAIFLDRETTKLDALLERKRTLIEKLRERLSTIISRIVSRGLPAEAARAAGFASNPKLKASGIIWLGDVPDHWEIKPLKTVARIGNGSTPNRDNAAFWQDGDYPWLNSSVVNQEVVTEAEQFVTPLALTECHLPRIQPPAVLVGITGQGRTRGMATVLNIEATINQHLAFVKPTVGLADAGFIRRVFDTAYTYLRSESDGAGSTKGAITCEQVKGLRIPIPPVTEQRAIAAFLDLETAKVDALLAKVGNAIERLQEYRTALITAAVTGKIDVRNADKKAASGAGE